VFNDRDDRDDRDSIRFRGTRRRQTLTNGDDDLPDGGLLVTGGVAFALNASAFAYFSCTLLFGTVGVATVPTNVGFTTLFGTTTTLIAVRTVACWLRWRRSRVVWRPTSRTPGGSTERGRS
jgi:hypothetical protein